jgi:hypothetical protein
MQGWIKLHRKLLDEGSDFQKLTATQQIITIYIILKANHKDGIWFDKYKNVEVPLRRGELVTSREKIKNWFPRDPHVTDRVIRTTLDKLANLNLVTSRSTNCYTVLNVVKYEVYQGDDFDSDQQIDQETTKRRPANDQVTTTNKNDKNDKNEQEGSSSHRKNKFSDVDLATAQFIFEKLQELNPSHKVPSLQKWANEIRLLRERDGRSPERVKELFLWANSHHFWRTNILSPSALRKQWDRLEIQRTEEVNKPVSDPIRKRNQRIANREQHQGGVLTWKPS